MQAIGCDIVQIPRIEQLIEKSNEAFLKRVYMPQEQENAQKYIQNPQKYASYLAKRFAAKEAFSKAVGTGFGKSIAMNDIGVINNKTGAPEFIFSGKAKQLLDEKFGNKVSVQLSLSDDYPQALAFVVINNH